MFDSGPIVDQVERSYNPNYKEKAARLKKLIDANIQCLNGMKLGISQGSVQLSEEDQKMFYAIIGKLSITIPEMENNYKHLLKKLEEKAV